MYKVSSILLLLVVILFLFSCKEKSPSEPEDTGETVGEVTIGTSGGTLETDDVILNVPPLAFSSETNLKLVVLQNQIPNSSSLLYKLEGLPLNYTSALGSKIKTTGSGTGESFIAIGEEAFSRALGTITTSYNFYDASQEGDFIMCELPVPNSSTANFNIKHNNHITTESVSIFMYAVNRGTRNSGADYHFVIKVSDENVQSGSIINLLNSLEDAYDTYESLTYDYSRRTNWPVTVNVLDLGENVFGYYADSYWGINHGYLEFNSRKLGSLKEARITAGHEFFHLVQSLYDPRGSYDKASGSNYTHYWLDEASGIWTEKSFTDDPLSYASPIASPYQMQPFEGMQVGISIGAREHGYGMSSVIRYLADYKYGLDFVIETYESLRSGAHPVKAIIDNTDDAFVWFENFFRAYILSEFPVSGVGTVFWRQNIHDTFTIANSADSVKTFSFAYPDLSARLYKIDITYSSIPEDASLNFNLTGDGIGEISIFRYKGGAIEFIGNDDASYTVANLKKNYVDEGWNLFALVTNSRAISPYTEKSSLDLKVKLVDKKEIHYARAELSQFYGTLSQTNDNGTTEIENYQFFSLEKEYNAEGTFSGHIFESDWDYIDGDTHYKGTMTLSFNESLTSILNFSVSGSEENLQTSNYKEFSFSGSDVPLTFQIDLGLEFRIEGTTLANHINSISYYYEYESFWNGTTTERLVPGTEYFVDFSELSITCVY